MPGNTVRVAVQTTGVKDSAKEVTSLHDAWKRFQKDGSKGLSIGVGAAATAKGFDLVGSALGGVVSAGEAAIETASALREATSLTGQVFEANSKKVEAWAAGAADAFGQSKREAMNFAAGFGTAFKNVGFSLDDTTAKSERLTQLAADLGSAFDASSDEAATALRSGLLGESEPLRRFGVFLDEAKVKAKAAAMGLQPLSGALSDGQKVAARYALILEQTADSQGMFGRDTESLADAQKRASAEMENAAATLGTKLLPMQLKLTKAVTEFIPVVTAAADGVGVLDNAVKLLTRPIELLNDAQLDSAIAAAKAKAAEEATAKAAQEAANALNTTANTLDDVADRGGRSTGKIVTDLQRVARASHNMQRDLLGDAQKLVTDYYDVLIARDDLSATNAEISALRKTAASRKLTKAEQADLHRLERTQAELESDLAKHGATQSKEFKGTMDDLLKRLRTSHGAEKRMIEAEILALKLLAIQAKITKGQVLTLNETIGATLARGGYVNAAGVSGRRAAGGPVSAGKAYIVGEHRPEVFVPNQSGTIIPSVSKATGGSGGGWNGAAIPIPVPSSWSPAMQQAFARDAAPAMARELQRQGFIPR